MVGQFESPGATSRLFRASVTRIDDALVSGERLLSAYELPGSHKVWIITEADRSATTLLLPEEY